MDLINSISKIYEEIGYNISMIITEGIKVRIEKSISSSTGAFNIILEIFVLERLLEDDYGIVLSTNAQTESHYSDGKLGKNESLFLMSDLSYGNGEVIDSTGEFLLYPENKESADDAIFKVNEFVKLVVPLLKDIIKARYAIP